ncbi:hypothetical protein C9J03_25335 [Photobacterium gaetbulicola]|uniref:CBS domain-containing protein n=1 Tax=Photobacterium gaetbulicola Gung47 TaxID=658445 RepID=A0A0C4JMZ4_9GAMM|nr:hypothetical protein [Photobacterium gaetbulicola]AHA59186.1 hypothetical protein H744_p0085 [Photobacterium gaetbulicola Gung47]PSU00013.1 hypothetical protein C9J03_25335 [Photobacterium gaetbulicola]
MRFPALRIKPGEGFEAAINDNSNIADAFRKFRETKADLLVLTDAMGKFKGVIRYKDVVEEIIDAVLEIE